MLKKYKVITAALAMGVCGNALAFNVDGNLDDWLGANAPSSATYTSYNNGYNIGNPYLRFEPTNDGNPMAADGSNSSWTPVGGVVSTVEDGYAVTPGDYVGGHKYEAAAMYSAVSGDHLYVAIVTGTPEDLGAFGCGGSTSGCWDPGDIAIYTGDHAFVLGADQYQFGLETTGRIGHLDDTPAQPQPQQTFAKGTLVKDAVWAHGLGWTDGTDATALLNGSVVGTVALDYDNNSEFWKPDWCSDSMGCSPAAWDVSPDNGWKPYYVIEAAIPVAMIGLTTQNGAVHYALSWTQNCGNDAVRLNGRISDDPQVPEAGALAVMMVGLAGLGVSRRRKQNPHS